MHDQFSTPCNFISDLYSFFRAEKFVENEGLTEEEIEFVQQQQQELLAAEKKARILLIVFFVVLVAAFLFLTFAFITDTRDAEEEVATTKGLVEMVNAPAKRYLLVTLTFSFYKFITYRINIFVTDPPIPLKIPNLTEICMEKIGPCWYHKWHTPANCKSTMCQTVMWRMDAIDTGMNFLTDTKNIDVPDYTRCGDKKW